LQNEEQNSIYDILDGYIEDHVVARGNKAKSWEYGYNDKYDMVVISKDGTIGDIYKISNLLVALPAEPKTRCTHVEIKRYLSNTGSQRSIRRSCARIKTHIPVARDVQRV
jgi:hypothetical protein